MVRPSAVISPVTEIARSSAKPRPASDAARPPQPKQGAQADISVVVRSKIQAPVLRSTTLSRKRLLDRLADATQSRLTLLIAEAGYGKTTLLTDFAASSGLRTLWYRLDPSDADPITWTNYLIAAAREVMPDFGKATESLLSQVATGSPPENVLMPGFLRELSQLGDSPTLLILDDLHLVDHNDAVAHMVSDLLRLAPPWMKFVISSRRQPAFPLARLKAMGELGELHTPDLCFNEQEIAALFAEHFKHPLDHDVVETLIERTRGWIASLQLFFGSVRGKQRGPTRELARSLSGATRPMYDFLAEEVLASVSDQMGAFLIRASLPDRVSAELVDILNDGYGVPRSRTAELLMEADSLGFMSRASEASAWYQMHPLLRDFLRQELAQRLSQDDVTAMHLRVAQSVLHSDPLTACAHLIEAGRPDEAMTCLGQSLVLTIGSGGWGIASSLIDRLGDTRLHPAVAAIQARRLLGEGEVEAARRLLLDRDVAAYPADVRAAVRQTALSLSWRIGDGALLSKTLAEIEADEETPHFLLDIARIFVDSSQLADRPAPLPELARRLRLMAQKQAQVGHHFYSAISEHNAAVAYLNSADYVAGIAAAEAALRAFARLTFDPVERYSTHSVLALCYLERGLQDDADVQLEAALSDGREFADVPSEMAFGNLILGNRDRAVQFIHRADQLQRDNRSDSLGVSLTNGAKAFMELGERPHRAVELLEIPAVPGPLDLGHNALRQSVLVQALILSGRNDEASALTAVALRDASTRGVYRAQLRLAVVAALETRDPGVIAQSLGEAAAASSLALLELADVLAASMHMFGPIPNVISESMANHPRRWLPALRRQLNSGDTPKGRAAARVLDVVGEAKDVPRLRAYARTYGRRGTPSVGIDLARRTSPPLHIHDLGRVRLAIADRISMLSGIRRKPATLLMYLVSRPSLSAHREQVLDALWPDADPDGSSNSLNQTLHFLRREIDPWYEDGVSAEYVVLQGDLLWLDAKLVKPDSVRFMADLAEQRSTRADPESVGKLIERYSGHFAPEFEYDEWATDWRTRLRSGLLSAAASAIKALMAASDREGARDLARATLAADPSASDIERTLVWLEWHLGAASAAIAQHEHLAGIEEADGLEPTPMNDLVGGRPPGLLG